MDVEKKLFELSEYCDEHINVLGKCDCALCNHDGTCITPIELRDAPDEMIHKWHAMVFPEPTFKDDVERMKYIRSKLDENELLCQLAEEAAELSKAASKLARIIRGKNPTPVTHIEALDNVFEELADVRVCMIALGYHQHDFSIALRTPDKINRWVERLQKMDGAV